MESYRAAEFIYISATKVKPCQPLPRKSRPSGRLNRGKDEQSRRRGGIRNDNGHRLQGHDRKHWKPNPIPGYMWTV